MSSILPPFRPNSIPPGLVPFADEVAAKIEAAGYEFATGVLGSQIAAVVTPMNNIELFHLSHGTEKGRSLLSPEAAIRLRDYLIGLELGD